MRDGAGLVAAVAALALLLRLPFLDAGYGGDSDAWRVASAAAWMAEHGAYAAPRLPGNPVHDGAMAALWAAGPAARSPRVLNGASALVAALGAGAFALAWRRRGLPDAPLAGLAAASVPALFVASVSTLDYAWGFAFVAAAIAAAAHGRATLAGILAALAVGTRLSNGVGLLGVALLLFAPWRGGRAALPRLLAFVAVWGAVGLLPYLPLWLERGPAALAWYDHGYPPPTLVVKKATVDLWGWPATVAWILVVAGPLARALAGRGAPAADPEAAATARPAAVTAAAAGAAWLRLPYKATYLVPAVPFLLLAHGALPRRALRALLAALVVSPWIVSVSVTDARRRSPPSSWSREVRLAGRVVVFDARGPVLADRAERVAGLTYGRQIALAMRRLPPGSVLVVQDWLPQLRLVLGDVDGPLERDGVLCTHLLDRAALARLRAEGRAIFFLPGVDVANRDRFGVDLAAAGALPLVP